MKYLRGELYGSIEDMPIFNWWKINETADVGWLLKNKRKLKNHELLFTHRAWRKVFDGYIERFGFAEGFMEVLNKEVEIALLQIEKAETGNETLQTIIEISEYNLNILKSSEQKTKTDFYENKSSMEKALGFRIDVKQVTVVEFMGYIKLLSK